MAIPKFNSKRFSSELVYLFLACVFLGICFSFLLPMISSNRPEKKIADSKSSSDPVVVMAGQDKDILTASDSARTIEAAAANVQSARLKPFLETYCIDCHGPRKQKGRIRFDTYDFTIADNVEALHYQDILDVLNAGDMPPEDETQPTKEELEGIIGDLTHDLFIARKHLASSGGKVTMRRLNRREYGATIRHLFGFQPEEALIPPDDQIVNFDTVGARQAFNTRHFDHYYNLAQEILRTGFKWAGVLQAHQATTQQQEHFWNKHFKKFIEQNKDKKQGKSVWMTRDRREYLALPMAYKGVYLNRPVRHFSFGRGGIDPRGTYRVHIKAGIDGEVQPYRRFLRVNNGEKLVAVARVDGTLENPQDTIIEITPETLGSKLGGRIDEDRTGAWYDHYLKALKRHEGVDPAREGMLWIDSVTVQGPYYPEHRSFFDTLLCPEDPSETERSLIVWHDDNASELIERFTYEACRRRQVPDQFINGLTDFFHELRADGLNYQDAMVDTLAVVLASPSFLFLNETLDPRSKDRRISNREIAIRLAYFLTSRPPDERLYESFTARDSIDTAIYQNEIVRLLKNDDYQTFTEGFAGQWAEFVRLDGITTSEEYPTFTIGLRHSMKQEVIAYFKAMIKDNLPVSSLIDSDFVTINSHIAAHYGIEGVTSNDFQKVALPAGSRRGGYLAQAAFLTAGSNGERSSPSIRGVMVKHRLMNSPVPPPPPNVPELVNDSDNPMTNRKLVKMHLSRVQCASCHREMDTIGLALENFDTIGRWRDDEKVGKESIPIAIEGALPDGQRFTTFNAFKAALMSHKEDVARHMIESLVIYALGRDIEFTDSPHIDAIMDDLRPNDFRMGDMLDAVATSPLFHKN